jgi:hypothetical protein
MTHHQICECIGMFCLASHATRGAMACGALALYELAPLTSDHAAPPLAVCDACADDLITAGLAVELGRVAVPA